jgi:hypothetical protein
MNSNKLANTITHACTHAHAHTHSLYIHTTENVKLVCIIKHIIFNEVHTTKTIQITEILSIKVQCFENETKSV